MKTVMYIHGDLYEKYQVLAAKEAGIIPFVPFKSQIVKKLFRLHNARPLNERHELPFKSIWYKRLLKGMDLKKTDEILFIFYESFNASYSNNYINYLKKKYPNSKYCYVFTNPPDDYNTTRVEKIRNLFDYIVSDVKDLAEKNNYLFYPFNPMSFSNRVKDQMLEYDVFFVGADKGRLPVLLSLFEKMHQNGLKCDFHIAGVSEEKKKYADLISYNIPLSYEEVLDRISKSRCVLEIVQKDLDYYTFRVTEAMLLHKKLISTNTGLEKDPLFNGTILKTFSISDCDGDDLVDFIFQEAMDNDFPDRDYWSFDRFLKFLQESN